MSQDLPPHTGVTRREFITKVGQFGGSAFAAMTALGFISRASGQGVDLAKLDTIGSGKNAKVIILGAGISGLCAAYELQKLGIDSVILESNTKAGGRCLTLRRGDKVEETTGVTQTCEFDDGAYFNPGPSRFPQWHITLDYCRELGVAIEPFVGMNENAYYYVEGEDRGGLAGKRIRIREAKTDLRGYTAELLAKAIDQEALDLPMEKEDIDRLKDFVRFDGGLSRTFKYEGHTRRGFEEWPAGGTQAGKMAAPHDMIDLVRSGFGSYFHRANEYEYFSQMFTPVGGMDKIAEGFVKKLKSTIEYGAVVKEIRHRASGGSRIVYEQNGETKEMEGDYCICTIPPTIMRRLPNDLAFPVKTALNIVPFQNSGKIGIQFKRRFWETDDQVYGGISWTNLPISEIWYPTEGLLGQKGVVGGYYIFGPNSDQVGRMTPAQRIEFALSHGEKIHPQYRAEFENAISVNWATLKHIEGCLAHFPRAMRATLYPNLLNGDKETYIAASWASYLGGWQAGGFESARLIVKKIYDRVQSA